MELTPEQKQALETQKGQCIFCKIIKGEVPSKKVYEDDIVIALLDINPAAKGHVLVMPKEHYPIMPLLPPPAFKHLFKATKALSTAISKAMVATGITIFIANGGAAGQQSPHFMLHIIPRDTQDDLSSFEIKKGNIPEKEQQDLQTMLSQRIDVLMAHYFKKNPASWHDSSKDVHVSASLEGASLPSSYTLPQVLSIISQNPALQKAIEEDPDAVESMISQHDQLKVIFKNISFDAVLKALHVQRKKKNKVQDATIVKEEKNAEKINQKSNQQKTQKTSQEKIANQKNKKIKNDQDDEVNLDTIADLL